MSRLLRLTIENVGLIARAQVDFSGGLTVVTGETGSGKTMLLGALELDGETVAHLPSDGVIVATPTGSTGYFMSAGGPIIHPAVDAIGVAGLLPHMLFARPLLVPSDATIAITCDGELTKAYLETDGMTGPDLAGGDRVVVRRTPRPVKFARVREGAFFRRLEDKLQWGVPVKDL